MILLLVLIVILLGLLWLLSEKSNLFEGFDRKVWFLLTAQSLVLSTGAGLFIWRNFSKFPQVFTDFISGSLAFSNTEKTSEYYGLYTTIGGFVLLVVLLGFLYRFVNRQDEAAKSAILKLSLYALIPSAILIGQSVRIADTTYLLVASMLFVFVSLFTTAVLLALLFLGKIQPQDTWEMGVKWMCGLLFLSMTDVGMAVLSSRLGRMTFPYGKAFIALLIGLFIFALIGWWIKLLSVRKGINIFFAISQMGIPLIFLLFAFPQAILKDGTRATLPFKPALYIFVAVLVLLTYGDLIRRYLKSQKGSLPVSQWFSPLVLFAVLLFLHSFPRPWFSICADNYHCGEFYLPFWQLKEFGYLPFADYQPARGLINYIPGFISWLFYDGSFSSQQLFALHTSAFYLFIGFFGLRLLLGDLGAFVTVASFFLYDGNLTSGILIAIVTISIICYIARTRSPLLALWAWLILSLTATLLAVAEGALVVIGSIPLALYLLYQAYCRQRKPLFISLGVLAAGSLVLLLGTRAGEMLLAIARYLAEQSGTNDLAHGIAWSYPPDVNQRVTSGYLWQIIRYSWLLLLIPIAYEIARTRKILSRNPQEKMRWFWIVTVFVMLILSIPRANGRVDPDAFSRPALVSIGFMLSVLPYLVLGPISHPDKRVFAILGISVVFGLIGAQEVGLRTAWQAKNEVILEPANVVSGPDLGLANMGPSAAVIDYQVNRQTNIKKLLDKVLRPDETYFDATNGSADYGYQGRPCPVPDCAPYNIPGESAQLRTVQRLEEKQIPLVLLSGERNNFDGTPRDGGPISLRNYWLYRYLVDHFEPFVDEEGFTWMIRKGQEGRLAGMPYKVEPDKAASYLEPVLLLKDLTGLPGSWGASFRMLASKLSNPVDLGYNRPLALVGVKQIDTTTFEVMNDGASITLAVPPGAKGDFLYIETVDPINGQSLEVAWSNNVLPDFSDTSKYVFTAGKSQYLIPLSSAPSWLLGQPNREIRLSFPQWTRGQISFKKVTLYDRVVKK